MFIADLKRASTNKQDEMGDTLEQQDKIVKHYAAKNGWTIKKSYSYVFSSAKEDVTYIDRIIDDIKKHPEIKILLVKDISRFSRHGAYRYMELKKRFTDIGVDLRDVKGAIGESINMLDNLNVEYDWSKFNPNEDSEIAEAN